VHLSPGPAAPLTARRLQAKLARVQVEGRLPSVVAALVRKGETVWSGGYGDVPGDPLDVQYRIGSITKTMTAVLLLQLVDEGAVSLDARVGSVLGDIGYADRTLRSLLAHEAGVQAEPTGPWWERSAGVSWGELAAANDGTGAVWGPDRQFHYSNLGYALLGEVVARLRGEPWWETLETRVLAPLGLERTTYSPEGVHAQGYSVHPFANTLTREPHTDTGAMAPAGQVWSTAADLATYATFLLQGHPDVLAREVLELATTPQAGSSAEGLGYAHALGFQLYAGGSGTLVGHSGSMPGFLAGCFVDRGHGSGAVLLSNATTGMTPSALATSLLEELQHSEPAMPSAWQPNESVPTQFAELLGVWHWGNTMLVLSVEGDELVVRRGGDVQYRYRVRSGRIVGIEGYQAGEELHVVRREDGSVSHLDLATFVLTRTPYDPSAPIPGGVPD
jgi:CubicO group peptidase (beta-lactamase class C family)